MIGLMMAFIAGITIFIGTIIVFLSKNNEKLIEFSISMAVGVMTTLLIFELLPESFELLHEQVQSSSTTIILIILGILLLKMLDLFIPDHNHDDIIDDKNLFHIGLVSSIALILHNIIEGMAIYSTTVTNSRMGLLVTLGIALHNIPLGIMITSTFYKSNNSKKKTLILILLIALSTLVGGLLMLFLSTMISDMIIGILLSITSGMLIYIILFELLPEVIKTKNKKISFLGIMLGIIIFLLTLFLE